MNDAQVSSEPGPEGRSRRSLLVGLAAVTALGAGGIAAVVGVRGEGEQPAAQAGPAMPRAITPATSLRPFSSDSPWNSPIPADPAIDPKSNAIATAVLRNRSLVVNTAIYAYGIPFYTASASTPRVKVKGRGSIDMLIPIDPSWKPNEGGDRKMNVLDPTRGLVYELQGFSRSARTAYWIVVRDFETGQGDGSASMGRTGPLGSGLSQAAGVVRIADIERGRIDHALSFITSDPAARRFRYPATHTDGTNTSSSAMMEGMRVQLDPALDLDGLKLGKAEKAIARALQVYGAFCTDNGRGNNMAMGFYMEKPTAGTGDPYRAAGLVEDWSQLRGIPRSRLRVLAESVTRP